MLYRHLFEIADEVNPDAEVLVVDKEGEVHTIEGPNYHGDEVVFDLVEPDVMEEWSD